MRKLSVAHHKTEWSDLIEKCASECTSYSDSWESPFVAVANFFPESKCLRLRQKVRKVCNPNTTECRNQNLRHTTICHLNRLDVAVNNNILIDIYELIIIKEMTSDSHTLKKFSIFRSIKK